MKIVSTTTVLYVIAKGAHTMEIKASKIHLLGRKLSEERFRCDLTVSAFRAEAYKYPGTIKVEQTQIEICRPEEFREKAKVAGRNKEIVAKIEKIWNSLL